MSLSGRPRNVAELHRSQDCTPTFQSRELQALGNLATATRTVRAHTTGIIEPAKRRRCLTADRNLRFREEDGMHRTAVRTWVIAIGSLVVAMNGSVDTAHAWQLQPVAEDEFPALEPPHSEPLLVTPLASAPAAETSETSGDEPDAPDSPFPQRPPQPPIPPAETQGAKSTGAELDESEIETPASSLSDALRGSNAPPTANALAELGEGVRAAAFRGVTPGVTSREELTRMWGAPQKQTEHNGVLTMHFTVAPFSRVETAVSGERVVSLVGYFRDPATQAEVAEMFDLAGLTAAVIQDERGAQLGCVYPERGLLLGYAAGGGDVPRVAQAAWEPVAAEGFQLRAEQHWRQRPQQSLDDLQQALQIQPHSTRAAALAARILEDAGKTADALTAINEAIEQAPDDAGLRLQRARLLLNLGRYDDAEADLEAARGQPEASLVQRAKVMLLTGDHLAFSPRRDVRTAMRHHQEAAQLAATALADAASTPRIEAAEVAIEADLAIARDLALGKWRQRDAAFRQWIDHAEQVAASLPVEEAAEWRFRIACAALVALSASPDLLDPTPYAAAANKAGQRLLSQTTDRWRRAQIQWRLGEALFEASQTLRVSGERDTARGYVQNVQQLLEAAAPHRDETNDTAHLLGRMYFALGVEEAVGKGDHQAAVKWYDKAAPRLLRRVPATRRHDLGVHGERMVSMGVSYWHVEQRVRAVNLTERGLRMMQDAVEQGLLPQTALAAPLNNLASMNGALGNEDQARQYRTRLVDFQTPVEDKPNP